jgi:ribose 1,5-bisphosphokinase
VSCEVEERFGPGCLALVVGPSGAGKDTLIRLVREAQARNGTLVFPRRIVTRAGNPWEDHDTVSREQFEEGLRFGLYPLHWEAHGLHYGLPVSVVTDVAAGRTVVANVSRHVIATARQLFVRVAVAYVTAPPAVLAQRLAVRGREAAPAGRIARAAPGPEGCDADCVIENVGDPALGAAALSDFLRNQAGAADDCRLTESASKAAARQANPAT